MPCTTTHVSWKEEERIAVGINPGFVRFSTGIEDSEDLIADFEQALNSISSHSDNSTLLLGYCGLLH